MNTKRIALACVSLTLLSAAPLLWAAPPLYFVSPQGNDQWSGTVDEPTADGADGPFQTLARAQQALRSHGGATGLPEGGTVYLREGIYFLPETLQLGPADSGTPEHPAIWQAYAGESVRLAAGKSVTGFTAHRGQIRQCSLDGQLPSGSSVEQLFHEGVRQTLARFPNKAEGTMPGGSWSFVAARVPADPKRSFRYLGDRPSEWASWAGLEVSIWPNYNWWQTVATVGQVDPDTHTLQLSEELPYTIEAGRRFFFQNILEELDAPGEWYYEAKSNILYFWPPAPAEDIEAVVPILDHAITLEQAAHINLIGFTLEATQSDAVCLKDCTACLVARCTVRNTGGFAIRITGGQSVRALGNDLYDTGAGGIVLDGGDRKTLTPGNHEATNNHIHDFGQILQTYQTAINIRGVGNRATHNLIHDAPHIGILLGGNDHLIEYNDIHHVCTQGSDNGGFYMGRDWTQRGNIIRYNKFHDIYGFGLARLGPDEAGVYQYESPHQAWGVYLDDCSSGTTIFGNLFYRIPLCGVMIGGGRDNIVENNIFAECIPALHIDDRWDAYCWDVMAERLEAMNYKKPPYSERYPELLSMGEDPRKPENNHFVRNVIAYTRDDFRGLSSTAPGSNSAVVYDFDQFDPESTQIDHNLIWHPGADVRVAWSVYQQAGSATLLWGDWVAKGFDQASLTREEPLFADANKDDYRIKEASAAFQLGFKKIPLHRIGLYQDEFRASWPPPDDTRQAGIAHRTWPVVLPPIESAPAAATPPQESTS